jgi:hypothetical protein
MMRSVRGIRRKGNSPVEHHRVELEANDILVYKGMDIDAEVLDSLLSANKRVLWAFVKNGEGDVRAVPYSEDQCIWMSESDIATPEEVEL